jgi:Na+-driven multidrug efflux pump
VALFASDGSFVFLTFLPHWMDYVLIFGIFGLNGFGVAGAAWATVIVRIIGTLAFYVILKGQKSPFPFFGSNSKVDSFSILKLSTPAISFNR